MVLAQKIADDVETPFGKAFLISLEHYYEQNGDLMRDPEMVFTVVDKREYTKNFESLFVYTQVSSLIRNMTHLVDDLKLIIDITEE